MIVEVRTYKIKPGLRSRFLDFFEQQAVPLQRSIGMQLLGPLVDLEDPDTFVWLRSFPSLAARERMKSHLYDGRRWKDELEGIALPMLESYHVVLAEAPRSFVNDLDPRGETEAASAAEGA